MNSSFKFALGFLALVLLVLCSPKVGYASPPQPRAVQTHAKKSAPSATAGSKSSPATGCSLLTPAMIKKVLGHSFQAGPPHKAIPMYGGAWGWSCHYFSLDQRNATVDFGVYAEASPAKAKQDFDTYSIAADNSKGNPSIGDSAYWVTNDKQEPLIYVLKGKVHFSLGMIPANEKQTKGLAAAVAAAI